MKTTRQPDASALFAAFLIVWNIEDVWSATAVSTMPMPTTAMPVPTTNDTSISGSGMVNSSWNVSDVNGTSQPSTSFIPVTSILSALVYQQPSTSFFSFHTSTPLGILFITSVFQQPSMTSHTPTASVTSTPTSSLPTPSPTLMPSSPPVVFPPPKEFELVEKGLQNFTIKWQKPVVNDQGVPPITGYVIEYESGSSSYNMTANSTDTNLTVMDGVKRATNYTVQIQAVYSTGRSIFTANTTLSFTTDSNNPPHVIKIIPATTSFVIVWQLPNLPEDHSPVTGYQLKYNALGSAEADETMVDIIESESQLLNKTVRGLYPFTSYNISIATGTKFGFGPPVYRVNSTRIGAPSQPVNASVERVTYSSITVSWKQPTPVNGPPNETMYIVIHRRLPSGNRTESTMQPELSYEIPDLQQDTWYTIEIRAVNHDGDDQHSSAASQPLNVTTQRIALPSPLKPQQVPSNDRMLTLYPVANMDYLISHYEVIVVKEISGGVGDYETYPNATGVPPLELKEYDNAHSVPENAVYLAAVYTNGSLPDQFELGDDKRTRIMTSTMLNNRTAFNGQLMESLSYRVFVRVYAQTGLSEKFSGELGCSTDGECVNFQLAYSSSDLSNRIFAKDSTEEESESQTTAVVVAVVVTLVVLCILVSVMLVYMKKNHIFRKLSRKHSVKENGRGVDGIGLTAANRHAVGFLDHKFMRTNSTGSLVESSVKVEDFSQHVHNMHMHSDIAFSEEYERLGVESKKFVSAASINPVNEAKNRYGNIYAYDHSRVRLAVIEGVDGSDYINANFISGFTKRQEYIAAQGPVPVTVGDFWRMTWENNCRIIVMTTNLRERGRIKCDQYWPDEGQQEFGDFMVALTEVADLSSYVIRTFKVWQTKLGDEEGCPNGECRVIYQYHFSVWPDHGVPEQASPLISFIQKIRNELTEDDGPLLVHCSAGVGRTGTFIALDVGLQQIEVNGVIDVRSLVARMRTERNLMVQTEAQYIFIYDALKEAVQFGVTEVPASEFIEHFESLQQIDEASGKSGVAEEYEKLSKDPPPPLQYCAGKRDVNAAKNRSSDIVPIEKMRVVIRKSPGIDGTDYINASFINDYRSPNAYIATQAPLAVTMEDFWRMVWEHGSSTIVMLSSLEEEGQLRYWPSKKNATFSNYRVELLSCQEYGTYSRRDFNLSSTGYDYTRTVRHFQLQVWPPDTVPDADVGVALLDLLNQVQGWQIMAAEGPVIVHCDYGVGRTGVFCALSILTKRLKSEGAVDVFQTVRSLRNQRPYMIQSQKQYEFIYKTLSGFIESLDPYSNFKRSASSPREE